LQEAQTVVEAWRRHFNAVRPHSSLNGSPPAPESIVFPAAHGISPWLVKKDRRKDERLAEIPSTH
jgi:transposase InsO family protein